MLVPLYKRIFLDASRAKSIFDEHFLNNPDFIEKIQEAYNDSTWGYEENNPLVWRMYLASSNSYKDYRCKMAQNIDLFKYYSTQSYPRFIWVLEIGTIQTLSQKESRVEVLLDATSSSNSNTWAILSIGYKGHTVFVPYVVDCLNKNPSDGIHFQKNEEEDYETIDLEKISNDVDKRILTEIFRLLYYKPNTFFDSTYKIFANSNLKEV